MPDQRDATGKKSAAEGQQQKGAADVAAPQLIKPETKKAKANDSAYERKHDPDRPFRSRDVEGFLLWVHLKKNSFAVWLPVLLSAVVLVVIIAQSFIYKRQLDAMDRQVELMSKQLEAQSVNERPYIVIEQAGIPSLAPGRPVSPEITIANKGKTPAQRLAMSLEIAAQAGFSYVLGFPPDSGRRPVSIPFLGAGDRVVVGGAPADAVTLDAQFFNDAIAGKESLMVYGRGSYQDMAGKEYPIEYSFGYHPTARMFVAEFGGPNRVEKWMDEKNRQQNTNAGSDPPNTPQP